MGAFNSEQAGYHRPALPFVSIITINYNQARLTKEFLDSVSQLTYPNFEVIVVDNGSSEDPTEYVQGSSYPQARLFLTGKNLGFSGGNNYGIQRAKGDMFFFVNNDTELTPDLLESLIETMLSDTRIGVVCPKIRYYDQPDMIQYAGYKPMNLFTGQTGAVGDYEIDRGQYNQPGLTNFAHGAAMLVRRDVIERVGSLEDQFFLYYEELDWSTRIRKGGYKIYYEPKALIFHKESVSVGRASTLKVYYLTRNRILYMRRNASWLHQAIFFAYFGTLAVPKHTLTYLLTGRLAYLKAFWRGLTWNFVNSRS